MPKRAAVLPDMSAALHQALSARASRLPQACSALFAGRTAGRRAARRPAAGSSPTSSPRPLSAHRRRRHRHRHHQPHGYWPGRADRAAHVLAEELDADWSKVRSRARRRQRGLCRPGLWHAPDRRLQLGGTPTPSTAKWAHAPAPCWWPRPPSAVGCGRRRNCAPSAAPSSAPAAKSMGYGELAEAAMLKPVPDKVQLKDPKRSSADRQTHHAPGCRAPNPAANRTSASTWRCPAC
jgi:hypothetical protein